MKKITLLNLLLLNQKSAIQIQEKSKIPLEIEETGIEKSFSAGVRQCNTTLSPHSPLSCAHKHRQLHLTDFVHFCCHPSS